MDLRKIIAARLRQQKIKVPSIARQINCSNQTLYNYLSGRTAIRSDLLEDMLKILKVGVK